MEGFIDAEDEAQERSPRRSSALDQHRPSNGDELSGILGGSEFELVWDEYAPNISPLTTVIICSIIHMVMPTRSKKGKETDMVQNIPSRNRIRTDNPRKDLGSMEPIESIGYRGCCRTYCREA